MSKFRSSFASDLDSLKSAIVSILALSVENALTEDSFNRFLTSLDTVNTFVNNRFYSDLIRKK